MPVAGRKPKDGPKRNTMPAAHDWVEVVDAPFVGRKPVVLPPKRRLFDSAGKVHATAWEPMTRTWWRTISSMPHCRLWSKADWQFAMATVVIADNAFRGSTAAAGELRQREKIMGTTLDARRDLRIRYVDKIVVPKLAIVPTSAVVSIDERRRRSTQADDAT
jgi:hypothetical protein